MYFWVAVLHRFYCIVITTHREISVPWKKHMHLLGSIWKYYQHLSCISLAVIVKTGEIFPATFPDRGPDQALRSARHFTGSEEVSVNIPKSFYFKVHGNRVFTLNGQIWVKETWFVQSMWHAISKTLIVEKKSIYCSLCKKIYIFSVFWWIFTYILLQ